MLLLICRAAARAISYAEKSSDEDESMRRGKRRESATSGDLANDDASDYSGGENDNEECGSDEDDDASVTLSSEGEINSPEHRSRPAQMSRRRDRITTASVPRSIRGGKVVDNNPNKLVRSVASGPLSNETKDRFYMRCFLKYKELHGDFVIMQSFIVPWSIAWPEEMWGIKLGTVLHNLRSGLYVQLSHDLSAIGVSCTAIDRQHGWDKIKCALEKYKELNGDLRVTVSFIIPSDSVKLPKQVWNMKLGIIVKNIRYYNIHAAHRDELQAMGINYPVKNIPK